MALLLLRKSVGTVAVFLAVITFSFVMIHAAPGDVAFLYVGSNPDPAELAQVRERLGLNEPFLVQYMKYMGSIVRGDLGRSILHQRPVAQMLVERAAVTIELALVTVAVSIVLAAGIGIASAALRGRWVDRAGRVATTIAISVPNFWIGLLLLMIFGLYVRGVLPAGGWIPISTNLVDHLRHLVLPVAVLSLAPLAIIARTLRTSLIEALQRDYVTFARGAGLSRGRVLFSVALPNAVIPTATVVGMLAGFLIGGSVIVEQVFTIPGIGKTLVDSFRQQDTPLAIGSVLFTAAAFLALNLLVDVSYTMADPRLRRSVQ